MMKKINQMIVNQMTNNQMMLKLMENQTMLKLMENQTMLKMIKRVKVNLKQMFQMMNKLTEMMTKIQKEVGLMFLNQNQYHHNQHLNKHHRNLKHHKILKTLNNHKIKDKVKILKNYQIQVQK